MALSLLLSYDAIELVWLYVQCLAWSTMAPPSMPTLPLLVVHLMMPGLATVVVAHVVGWFVGSSTSWLPWVLTPVLLLTMVVHRRAWRKTPTRALLGLTMVASALLGSWLLASLRLQAEGDGDEGVGAAPQDTRLPAFVGGLVLLGVVVPLMEPPRAVHGAIYLGVWAAFLVGALFGSIALGPPPAAQTPTMTSGDDQRGLALARAQVALLTVPIQVVVGLLVCFVSLYWQQRGRLLLVRLNSPGRGGGGVGEAGGNGTIAGTTTAHETDALHSSNVSASTSSWGCCGLGPCCALMTTNVAIAYRSVPSDAGGGSPECASSALGNNHDEDSVFAIGGDA